MKKFLLWTGAILIIVATAAGIFLGPSIHRFMTVTTVVVDPNLTVYLGGGGNSIVLKFDHPKEVLVVDTKIGSGAKTLKQAVEALGPDTKVTVINTHYHSDHTGGNKFFPKATLIAGAYSDELWKSQAGKKLPDVKVQVNEEKSIAVAGETVKIFNVGQAHTSNDLVVYLVNHQLLVTGDLVFNGWHPALVKSGGANVAAWIKALESVAGRYNAKIVVPGHGPVGDMKIVSAMHDYFADIYAALGNPEQLKNLKAKYRNYIELFHGMTSFNRTVAFITEEKKASGNK